MATLTKLDVINACLSTMGETPINEINEDHPYVAAALNQLSKANTLEQARGWWFNTDAVSLLPDSVTGFVYVPQDTINVFTAYPQLVVRGRRIYNRVDSTYDLRSLLSQTGSPLKTVVVREIVFEDLPVLANHLVAARTARDFQSDYDGDSDKYKKLEIAYTQANTLLGAEDIRMNRPNLLKGLSVQTKLRLIQPISRYSRRGW